MEKLSFTADIPERVDVFLAAHTELTRSAIKRIAEENMVWVNGVNPKSGTRLKIGDVVEIEIPDPLPIEAKAEDIPINIVYEDDDLAVINKPQGMVVHPGWNNYEGTLVNALLFHLNSLSGINGALRPGIVHRLDKDTSGLLVVAKNDEAHLSLSKQIAEKSAKREYYALLEGVVKQDSGTIVTNIGRDYTNTCRQVIYPEGRGRRAETDYFVVERFKNNTLMRFSLKTGRTHQIRVHAKYMGHPVVGDLLYGYKKQRFQLNGQLLHAYRLTFTHPKTGQTMTFEAPMPEYFLRILEILRSES